MRSDCGDRRTAFLRWMKFNLVGWIGIGVQLAVLTGLPLGDGAGCGGSGTTQLFLASA